MKTHHFFIDQTGVLKVIQEMPVKSKTIYDQALQKAKEDAIEVMNQDEVHHRIYPGIDTATKFKLQQDRRNVDINKIYSLECNVLTRHHCAHNCIDGSDCDKHNIEGCKWIKKAIITFEEAEDQNRPIEELFVEEYFGLKDVNENHPITTDYGHLVNLLTGFKEKHMKH